jgi:hypothetical protein
VYPQAITEIDDTFVDIRLDLELELELDDAADYASYELEYPSLDELETIQFVRADPDAIVVAEHSVPYERTPFVRVARSADLEIEVPPVSSHMIVAIAVLICALAFGIGVALVAI